MPVFFFTDVEGSTKKWEKYPEQMKQVLVRHDMIIKTHLEHYGGKIIKHTGDGVFAVFEEGSPLFAAIEIQKRFQTEDWSTVDGIRIRIGLHAGNVEKRGEDYFGPVINRTARVMAAAWGGQIILTPEVRDCAQLPEGSIIRDLGSHLLKDLGSLQKIYQITHPDLTMKEFPPLRSLSSRPHNLPMQSTPFIGREKELLNIKKLLEDTQCRLLTLVGPGGVGKTRCVLQAAAEKIDNFCSGVYFISLESLLSPHFLILTIAEGLRFTFYPQEDEKTQLFNYLKEKEVLLILDNFEAVIQGATLISEILKAAPKVKIMITSREPLNIQGEWLVQVDGMTIPDGLPEIDEADAVQLFYYNAQRAANCSVFTEEDKKNVVRICQLVQGLPLGIELAASWLRTLSCKDIAQEMEKNIDFLATSMHDIPERHRSLRAVFDYSWNLLTKEERSTLVDLSVFQGGFQRDAGAAICKASLPALMTLVDKSLLRRSPSNRYEMLTTLKQYVAHKLDQASHGFDEVRDIHCDYYVRFLNERGKKLFGEQRIPCMNEITSEMENIQAAWTWATTHLQSDRIEKLVRGLIRFLREKNWYKQGQEMFTLAIDQLHLSEDSPLFAQISRGMGIFEFNIGDLKRAEAHLTLSMAAAEKSGNQEDTAEISNDLGMVLRKLGRPSEAEKLHMKSMETYKKSSNRYGIAYTSNLLAYVCMNTGDYRKAHELAQHSLTIWRDINDLTGTAVSLDLLARGKLFLGEYDTGIRLYGESLEVSRRNGDKFGIARALNNLATAYHKLCDYERAESHYRESLAIQQELGHMDGQGTALLNLGEIARQREDFKTAVVFHERALHIYRQIGHQSGIGVCLIALGQDARRQGDYDKALKLQEEGLEVVKAVNDHMWINWSYLGLYKLRYERNEYTLAEDILRQCLQHAIDKEFIPIILESLVGYAELLHAHQKDAQAMELLLLTGTHHARNRETELRIEDLSKEIRPHLTEKEIAVAKKRAAAVDVMTVARAILTSDERVTQSTGLKGAK